jgi:hypothetical protein
VPNVRGLAADHVRTKFLVFQPARNFPAQDTMVSVRIEPRSAFAGNHQHEFHSAGLRVAKEPHQRAMRFALRESMKVNPRFDRLGPAGEPLPRAPADRRERGWRIGSARDGRARSTNVDECGMGRRGFDLKSAWCTQPLQRSQRFNRSGDSTPKLIFILPQWPTAGSRIIVAAAHG